jgi:multidrug efflux pump subunit AcrA (membrane-fusion protein)
VRDPYRKQALDRLSSPEELDRLVRVARPGTWIALGGLLVVVAAVVLWATLSTVTTTASGLGFVLPQGGLIEASAARPGIVRQIEVRPDERVQAGDVVARLDGSDGRALTITAATSGRVGELAASLGDFVQQGGEVAILVPDRPHIVEAFLPTTEAKKAHLGDQVWISPTTAPASEFGYARGRVASISDIPITDAGVGSLLENPARVRLISGLGPVVHVVVTMQHADTPSGLSWTASEGPPDPVSIGSRATVSVVTGERAPIDYVVG